MTQWLVVATVRELGTEIGADVDLSTLGGVLRAEEGLRRRAKDALALHPAWAGLAQALGNEVAESVATRHLACLN